MVKICSSHCTVSPSVNVCSYKLVIRYPTIDILIIVCYQMIEFLFSEFNIVFFQNVSERQGATCTIALLVQGLKSKDLAVG